MVLKWVKHHVVAFDLRGKIDYPLMVSNSHSRGKELPVAKQMVEKVTVVLGDHFPQLFLLDSLYFIQPFFECIRSKGAHLLIKSDEPSFREVLVDAKFAFENKNDLLARISHTPRSFALAQGRGRAEHANDRGLGVPSFIDLIWVGQKVGIAS
jgi:hypothetical protein